MRRLLQLHLSRFLLLMTLIAGVNMRGQATLPVTRTTWDSTPTGWTDAAGGSYLTSFACTGNNGAKFDTTGNNFVVNFSGSPDKLSFTFKSNGTTSSSLLVEESSNGTTYTTVVNLSNTADLPTTCTTKGPYQLNSASRYVRWKFTKGSQNGTMDDVSITAAAFNPNLAISGTTGFGSSCVNTPSSSIQYTITNTGSLTANGITVTSSNPSEFTVSGLSSTSIATNGTATYNVIFTPSASGSRSATITVASTTTGSNSPTSALTGTGTAVVAQAVTTNAATGVGTTVATLNGNLTAVGSCPTITEKGFVYALTSANNNPLAGGSGVTKTVVSGITTGAYTLAASSLISGSGYTYKAYAYNGTTYTYGAVQSFTTTLATPALTAAANATVDAPFTVAFTDDAAWRAAITSITIGGTTLSNTAYAITAGQITFTPSASTLLQTSGSKTIAVIATGYGNATVTQALGAGVAAKLIMNTQPAAPATNGAVLATQPKVNIVDQYGNATTSTATVTAAVGAGTWTLGGTAAVNGVSGLVTFAGLTATSTAAVTGATIVFTATGLTGITSGTFNITAPAPANDLCANAIALTINAPAINGTLASATYTSFSNGNAYKDVWYSITPLCSGSFKITVSSSEDPDIYLFNACPTNNNSYIANSVSFNNPEVITTNLVTGNTYILRVLTDTYADDTPFTIKVESISEVPTVTASAATAVSYAGATVSGTATVTTCSSAITSYGIEYSTVNGFANGTGTQKPGTNLSGTAFSVNLTGLGANTVYYYKAYAVNATGTAYSSQGTFTTLVYTIAAPVATAATYVSSTGFNANWNTVADAESYRMDVSLQSSFTVPGPGVVTTETFTNIPMSSSGTGFSGYATRTWTGDAGIGWTATEARTDQTISGPAITLNSTSTAYLQSDAISGGVSNIKFDVIQAYSGSGAVLTVKVLSGTGFATSTTVGTISFGTTQGTFNSGAINITGDYKIKIENNGAARPVIDNLIYTSAATNVPTFVPGYENIQVTSGLTSAVTGLLPNTTYYYRVRSENAAPYAVSSNSNTISVTTGTSKTWNGTQWTGNTAPTVIDDAIIAGDYNTTANGAITASSLTVNSGIITVKDGTTLNVQNAIVNNAGISNFIVENNAAVVQVNPSSVNQGGITVQKSGSALYRQDYTIWSSPVAGQTLKLFSPATLDTRFYGFNAVTNLYSAIANPATTVFDAGKGYLIRMPNQLDAVAGYNQGTTAVAYAGEFKGVANNGIVSVAATPYAAGSVQGYNIIGNPYPSPINVQDFYAANIGNLGPDSALYFWRKRNDITATSYATLTMDAYTANAAVGGGAEWSSLFNTSNPANWVINPGQGFFVQAGSNAIVFNNSMRRGDVHNGQFFKQANQDTATNSRLWLNITGANSAFSQIAVVYSATATLGLDYGREATSLSGNIVRLYSIAENTYLNIQARPSFTVNDVVKLGYQADAAGAYSISLYNKDGVFADGQTIYLKDKVTGTTTDITGQASYNFVTEAGTFNDRFEVLYEAIGDTAGTDNPVLTADNVVVYHEGNGLTVATGTVEMQGIAIYDIRGRLLYSQDNINSVKTQVNLQAQQQVLIVNITTSQGRVSKKIVY